MNFEFWFQRLDLKNNQPYKLFKDNCCGSMELQYLEWTYFEPYIKIARLNIHIGIKDEAFNKMVEGIKSRGHTVHINKYTCCICEDVANDENKPFCQENCSKEWQQLLGRNICNSCCLDLQYAE